MPRLDDDCRRVICEFLPTGTVLQFLRDFQEYAPDLQNSTTWRAYLADGVLVHLEYTFFHETKFLIVTILKGVHKRAFSIWNYKETATWTFREPEELVCLHTAPEFDEIMHLQPTRYERRSLDLRALFAGLKPFYPRPALKRRNRVKAVMEAVIEV